MTSLNALRKASENSLAQLSKKDEKQGGGSRYKDERIWKPTFNKEKGRGSALIRFLPACPAEENEMAIQTLYSHNFKGPTGQWYIENSLSTKGVQDCVGAMNSRLYKSGIKSDEDVAKKYQRKVKHYANVLVIKDPAHPENDGKVFIYEFGKEIYNIIKAASSVQDDDDDAGLDIDEKRDPINPFDVINGADFAIKMTGKTLKVDGKEESVPTYIQSEFREPSPLFDGDEEKIVEVWKQCHPLLPFVSDDKFKTNEELKKRLVKVLGTHVGSGVLVVEDTGDSLPASQAPKHQAPDNVPPKQPITQEPTTDEDLSLLDSLFNDD